MNRFLLSSNPGSAAVSLALACLVMAAPAHAIQAWSTIATTGTIDDGSAAYTNLNGSAATVLSTATLPRTITLRYQIHDEFGSNASPKWLGVRFIDNGPNARVVVQLRKQALGDLPAITLINWDSNLVSTDISTTQFRWTQYCSLETLDFINYSYWIEAQITKSSSTGSAALSQVRLDNDATTCVAGTGGAEMVGERVVR